MLFQENPLNLYHDTYFLVKVLGFSGEYVEGMVPNERELYKNIYFKQQEEEKKSKEEKKGIDLY